MQVVEITTTSARRNIVVDESRRLGSGAAGDVLPISGDSQSVVKIYHSKQDARKYENKILAMLKASPDGLEIDVDGLNVPQFTWPTAAVYSEKSEFIGFKMSRLDMAAYIDLEQLLQRKTRECEHLPESYLFRYTIARNLASAIEKLHRQGHFIVDLKPVNLLVHRTKPVVAVVDCDGFSIRVSDDRRYPAEQFTPDYLSPESHDKKPELLGDTQDRFALSVVIFQLLNNGVHPYQFAIGKNSTGFPDSQPERIKKNLYVYGRHGLNGAAPHPLSIHKFLEDDTLALFERAFLGLPTTRPQASEWTSHLDALVKQGRIRSCAQHPKEHFHFTKLCGLCAIDQKRAVAIPSQHTSITQVSGFQIPISRPQALPIPKLPSNNSGLSAAQILQWLWHGVVYIIEFAFLIVKWLIFWTRAKLILGRISDYAQLVLMYGGIFSLFVLTQSLYKDFSFEKVWSGWPGWFQTTAGKVLAAVPADKNPITLIENETAIDNSISGKFYVLRNANVRSGPSQKFGVISTLDANTEIDVLGKSTETDWYQIAIPNTSRKSIGFISNKLVTAASNCKTVTIYDEVIKEWKKYTNWHSTGTVIGGKYDDTLCSNSEKGAQRYIQCTGSLQRNYFVLFKRDIRGTIISCRADISYECAVKDKVRKDQLVCTP